MQKRTPIHSIYQAKKHNFYEYNFTARRTYHKIHFVWHNILASQVRRFALYSIRCTYLPNTIRFPTDSAEEEWFVFICICVVVWLFVQIQRLCICEKINFYAKYIYMMRTEGYMMSLNSGGLGWCWSRCERCCVCLLYSRTDLGAHQSMSPLYL